ncbi:hypothetical protein LJR074_001932 [Acidovorax sp. LjRoot74]|uniref:hypothetical protein n=1 Tax=Acidovorax sp. LjRoot74 TaxID=3342337 RepID=UPI003ECCF118
MDVNQTVGTLADAASAAQPPQEYCFLWIDWWATCMSKAEWSGWMQAVFSVVAILASALIVRYQMRHQELMVKRSAISRIRTFIAFLSSYADRFVNVQDFNEIEMKRQAALLNEQITLAATIPAELLKIEWIGAFEGARAIAVQFKVLADAVAANPSFGPQSRAVAQQLAEKLKGAEATVTKDHPGVRVKR